MQALSRSSIRCGTPALAVLLIALFGNACAAGGDGMQSLSVQGQERFFLVRTPRTAPAPASGLPLVLVLHGGGGNADNAEKMTGFTAKARQENFIVAYPEGTGRFKHALLTWNAGHCCGPAMQQRVDDVGFIRALIARMVSEYGVDPKRVYVTGMSNGAMMAHRLGIELSDRIAAIAPVVGTLFGNETKPPNAVAALMINGRLDRNVPDEGGAPGGRFANAWDGAPTLPALAQGSFWAAVNGCQPDPQTSTSGAVTRSRYLCANERDVELLLLADNGHAWPGGRAGTARADVPSTAIDATDAIWRFFNSHAR